MIDINHLNNLYSYLQTPKKNRITIKKIYFNLNYNISDDKIFFDNFRIDNGDNENEIVKIINDFYSNKDNNTNTTRRMLNKLFLFHDEG